MKNKNAIYFIFSIGFVLLLILYVFILNNNIKNEGVLLIPTDATFNTVMDSLKKHDVLKNNKTFIEVAKKLDYPNSIKPGRYIIKSNTSNLSLLRKLKSGRQDAVKVVITNIATLDQLASKMAAYLEPNKKQFYKAFTNKHLLDSLQLNEDNVLTIFLANTYEMYWNTSADNFVQKMLKEYSKFWNNKRTNKAEDLGLSPTQITILASIVQKESNQYDEYSTIAGVYYNRLKSGMKLQADPTVLYAKQQLGSAQRVYNSDTKLKHPYNTYVVLGLPPGPICLPELKSIELCLDLEKHDYMFFCAKDDFSGYHSFAKDWATHQANAKKFHDALNQKNIK